MQKLLRISAITASLGIISSQGDGAPAVAASTPTRTDPLPAYHVTDLGAFDGQDRVVAIAPDGAMAGYVAAPGSSTDTEPAIWVNGIGHAIWLPSSFSSGTAVAINDNNQILGTATKADGSGTVLVVITWSIGGSTWTQLPQASESGVQGSGINDRGEVAGSTLDGRIFTWTPGGNGYTLHVFGRKASAYGIDTAGDVIGHGKGSGMVWYPDGTFAQFGLPGVYNKCGSNSWTSAAGFSSTSTGHGPPELTVVGDSNSQFLCPNEPSGTPDNQAMAWRLTTMDAARVIFPQVIPSPAGSSCADPFAGNCNFATAVNGSSTIVGHGIFLNKLDSSWVDLAGHVRFIHPLLDPADQKTWITLIPVGIDNAGDILAVGTAADLTAHSVLLRPTYPPVEHTLFSNDFDSLPTGSLRTGKDHNQFTGTSGPNSNIRVVNYYSFSGKRSLGVNVQSGGSAYAYKTYSSSYANHTLTFHVMFASNFAVASGGYMTLAGTEDADDVSDAGTVELNADSTGRLFLSYWNASGHQEYIYSNVSLQVGSWHDIALQEVVGGKGMIALTVDGKLAAQTTALLPNLKVGSFAVGNIYCSARGGKGQVYFDDVSASTQAPSGPRREPMARGF